MLYAVCRYSHLRCTYRHTAQSEQLTRANESLRFLNGKPYLLSVFLSVWIPFYTKFSEMPKPHKKLPILFKQFLPPFCEHLHKIVGYAFRQKVSVFAFGVIVWHFARPKAEKIRMTIFAVVFDQIIIKQKMRLPLSCSLNFV